MQPEILGKERRRKKPWVTKDVLDLCDERRDLKKRYEAEGAKNTGKFTQLHCTTRPPLNSNSKRAYKLVKDLTG